MSVLEEYEQAVELLRKNLMEWSGTKLRPRNQKGPVPLYAHYDHHMEQDRLAELEASMVLFGGGSLPLIFVPVALYERGDIAASVALAGPGHKAIKKILEILVVRDRSPETTWLVLETERSSETGKFPTRTLREYYNWLMSEEGTPW